MARWQLTEPHYLNVPGNVWEQTYQDRGTGRTIRKQFPVPLHLDPNIESDWNHRDMIGTNIVDGKIVVCYEGKGEPKDIIFVGPPTPGMLPLDAEAKELSSQLKQPITQGLDEMSQHAGWQTQLLVTLSDMKDQVAAQPKIEGLAEFMKSLSEVMSTQTQILASIAGKGTATTEAPLAYDPAKHVVDDEAPIEDPDEITEEELRKAEQEATVKHTASQVRAAKRVVEEGLRRF